MISRKNLARLSLISVKILLIGLLLLLPSFNSFGEEGSWSFAFMADTRSRIKDRPQGVNARILNLIAKEIALDVKDQSTNCELVLVGGDLILGQCSQKITQSNKAAYQQWKGAMKPVYEAFHEKKVPHVPIYPVRGNHEVYHIKTGITQESVINEWMSAFGNHLPQNGPPPPSIASDQIRPQKGLNYFVKHKNALFVAVDQYVKPGYGPSVNQEWLDHVLTQEKTGPHVFVFGHTPAWQTVEGKKSQSLFSYPEIRDKFWDSLRRGNCRVYLAGHQHYTAVKSIKGEASPDMWQVMSGSGGAPLDHGRPRVIDPDRATYLNTTDYGYYIVKVDGNEVTLKFKYYTEADNKWITDARSIVRYNVR